MQKLIEMLQKYGIEIPADKQADIKKDLSEHYKNAAEYTKAIGKLETERDGWKKKAEDAEATLKGFEGVDLEKIRAELADWKKKAADAEETARKQLYERDFNDALKEKFDTIKFTSEAAKKAIMEEVRGAGLTLKDGKILGLDDLIGQIRERDASAFVDEGQQEARQNAAQFTTQKNVGGTPGKKSLKEMSLDERIKLKQSDPELYKRMKG